MEDIKKFEKNVAILSQSLTLYLKKNKIDSHTYNGSQLHYDMIVSLANNNPNIKYYVLAHCADANTNVNNKNRQKNIDLLKSIFKYYDPDPKKSNIEFIVENKYRLHYTQMVNPNITEQRLKDLVNELSLIGIDYGIIKGGLSKGLVPHLDPNISKKNGQFDKNGNIIKNKPVINADIGTIYSIYFVNNYIDKNGKKLQYITINDDDNFCGLRDRKKHNKNVVTPEVVNINMYNGFNYYELYSELDPYIIKKTNNGELEWKKHKVPIIFKEGMDTILLKSDTMKNLNTSNTNRNGIFMYMNFRESNGIRYQRFEDYILKRDFICNTTLWTDLKDRKKLQYKQGYFKDFKKNIDHGIEGHEKTMEELCKAKYTLCISAFKTQQCIGRFWEAVYCGVIPFVQREVDTDGNLIDGIGSKEWREMYNIPDFLFVKTPKEFEDKINLLERDNNLYLQILNDVKKLLKPEYLDKNQINKIIMETVDKYIK